MNDEKLHSNTIRLLKYIYQYHVDEGVAPSTREMGSHLNLSINNISHHLKTLERERLIERKRIGRSTRTVPRGVTVTSLGRGRIASMAQMHQAAIV